ncbi:MAG: RNA polymerase sigma factor [Vicinamibacterales bacterium]
MGHVPGMTEDARFEAFVREYQHLVFATAVRLVGNRTEAEDIAQTVFLKAFERADAVVGHPAAAGWLKTVTTNLSLNHLTRYRARWQFFSEIDAASGHESSADFAASLPAPDGHEPGDGHAGADARMDRLEAALQALPDHQRVPLVLFHFEAMSYDAIAASLGVSLGKVKTDIHRGRLALRRVLGPDDGHD